MWWINLGGIKLLWGFSASQATAAGGSQYTFTLPAFFTTVSVALGSVSGLTTDARQYTNVESATITSVVTNTTVAAGTAAANIGILVIGT